MAEGPGWQDRDTHPAPSPLAGAGRGEGVSGHDKGARADLLSCPMFSIPLLSFPTFLIGNPWLSPCRVTRMKGQKSKTLDSR